MLFSIAVSALGERLDMDIDDDGLIEIYDHHDLDDIRNHLDGSALYGSSVGCPITGCFGFELTRDIDLDTNFDGVVDSEDFYWRDGYGWAPIGAKHGTAFSATFNGNGHEIKNLFIDSAAVNIGFFGYANGATIINLGILANNTSVAGFSNVGIFAGEVENSIIRNSYSQGNVSGIDTVAGLIGTITNSEVLKCYSSASVVASSYAAGFISFVDSSQIVTSFSSGFLDTTNSSVALHIYRLDSDSSLKNSYSSSRYVGQIQNLSLVASGSVYSQNSYWAKSISSNNDSNERSFLGLDISTLKCVGDTDTTPSHVGCDANDSRVIFKEWNQANWNFGNSDQLPGILINGVVHRDSDGDGIVDQLDDYPVDWRLFKDSDFDGYPDHWNQYCDNECVKNSGFLIDQFPTLSAVHLDLDFDSLPDSWNSNCDLQCQSSSGLTLDAHLNDEDNDGVQNEEDHDDNGDGLVDADVQGNGLIEISTLEQLYQVNFNLDGTGRVLEDGGVVDSSGCPRKLSDGRYIQVCNGYELIQDLDFDTNKNGIIDAEDEYSNIDEHGVLKGWDPIGSATGFYQADFNGNGFAIINLFINRPESENVGLFSAIKSSLVSGLAFLGSSTEIVGDSKVGALAGTLIEKNVIDGVFVRANLHGSSLVGGIAGYSKSGNVISNVLSSSNLSGEVSVAGIVGEAVNTGIKNTLTAGRLTASSQLGGIVGHESQLIDTSALKIESSYWSWQSLQGEIITTGILSDSYYGYRLVLLQLAGHNYYIEDTYGDGHSIFRGWPIDPEDSIYWRFGTPYALPSLVLNGKAYSDSDGDTVIDNLDLLPLDFDNDRVQDFADGFPSISIAGFVDNDGDGIPFECDQSCIELGLEADEDDNEPFVNPLSYLLVEGDNGETGETLDDSENESSMGGVNNNVSGGGSLPAISIILYFLIGFRSKQKSSH